ncbi:MAG: InlB B-repeat-containing protein [Firmicutes bacterium]|nr:InlB B-repeat-containing protein [Bacillota bacterium]
MARKLVLSSILSLLLAVLVLGLSACGFLIDIFLGDETGVSRAGLRLENPEQVYFFTVGERNFESIKVYFHDEKGAIIYDSRFDADESMFTPQELLKLETVGKKTLILRKDGFFVGISIMVSEIKAPNIFTVVFDANGGEFPLNLDGGDSEIYIHETEGLLTVQDGPLNPFRAQYDFLGWFCDSGTKFSPPMTVNSHRYFYARWAKANPVTVTLRNNSIGKDETVQIENGEDFTFNFVPPASETPTGFSFVCWTNSANALETFNTGDTIYNITTNLMFVAKFERIVYTLTFVQESGASISRTVQHGGSLQDIPAVALKAGHNGSWVVSGTLSAPNYTNITRNQTFEARYEIMRFNIVFNMPAFGSVLNPPLQSSIYEDFETFYNLGQEDDIRTLEITSVPYGGTILLTDIPMPTVIAGLEAEWYFVAENGILTSARELLTGEIEWEGAVLNIYAFYAPIGG